MKYLKNICIILCLVGITQYASGQVYKFQTTGFTVSEKNEKGVWGKWSDFQEASLVVTLDTNKNRIIIYSQEIQLYEIVNYEEKQDNENDECDHGNSKYEKILWPENHAKNDEFSLQNIQHEEWCIIYF